MWSGKLGQEKKINKNVFLKREDDGIILFYFRAVARRHFNGDGTIYGGTMDTSPTVMGYYRALFDLNKEQLGIRKGNIVKPDWITWKD